MNTILSDESINAQQQSQPTLTQPSDATILPSPTTTATAATTPSNENNIGDTSEQYRVVEGTKNWTKQKKITKKEKHTHIHTHSKHISMKKKIKEKNESKNESKN